MRISLIISFLLHLFLLMALNKVLPYHWKIAGFRTYRVDLIRPPVEDLRNEDISAAEIAALAQEKPAPQPDDQDTISLDTKDKRYMTYARLVKGAIMHHWKYPRQAQEYLVEGNLTVVFGLGGQGNMIQVTISRTSGHEILDQEAVRAITRAAPFPPFPDHIKARRLNIIANFDYRLTSRK